MSMRKVADAAGITAPAIYRHFQSREALLGEIVEIGLRELEKYLRPALKSGTPYERVRQLADRYSEFALEQPKYFEVAFLNAGTKIEWLSKELAHPMWDVFRAAIAQIEMGMERGELRRDDPISTAILIWATAHGLVRSIGSIARRIRSSSGRSTLVSPVPQSKGFANRRRAAD